MSNINDQPDKVKSRATNLENSPIVTSGPYCLWNGVKYSTGAKVCSEADHHIYQCMHEGSWWDTGDRC